MNIEEYRNKRRNRLQKLNEKLSNMPELTDDKVHGEVDVTVADAIKTSNERDKLRKDSFKDKNKEVREFIKKQDKDREVDADDKSEKRLMLDESLFTEDADGSLAESSNNFADSLSHENAESIKEELIENIVSTMDDDGLSVEDAVKKVLEDYEPEDEDIISLAFDYSILVPYRDLYDKVLKSLYDEFITKNGIENSDYYKGYFK